MNVYRKSLVNLFVSKVRVKAIRYFMLHPKRSIHLRGAVRELEEEINAVRRELMRLCDMDLLQIENKGNRKYFRANEEHPFFDELIKMVHKSTGLGAEIISQQNKLGTIEFALLTSSFTKGTFHGEQVIDIFFVGNVDINAIDLIVSKYETDTGREVRYTVMKLSEFQTRKRRNDSFIIDLMVQDSVMLIGTHDKFVRGRG